MRISSVCVDMGELFKKIEFKVGVNNITIITEKIRIK